MTANEVKSALLQYYRYKRQFPVVAVEAACAGWGSVADVLCIDKKGRYWETEVKVSLSDLKADQKKPKHQFIAQAYHEKNAHLDGYLIPARFYFCITSKLLELGAVAVVGELYPYAGVLVARNAHRAFVYRQAPSIHDEILAHDEAWKLVKAQSATLVRTFEKLHLTRQ